LTPVELAGGLGLPSTTPCRGGSRRGSVVSSTLFQRINVLLDGEPRSSHGVDVDENGNGLLRYGRLYQLARQAGVVHERTMQITFFAHGAEAYAFTFG
jgi:hypothetical protein